MNTTKTILHRDGSVTFWDVYAQQWVRTNRPADRDFACMDTDVRARVERHLAKHDY